MNDHVSYHKNYNTILDTPQNTCKIDKINVIFLVTIGQISQPWTIVGIYLNLNIYLQNSSFNHYL
jgi:hypothetical protein